MVNKNPLSDWEDLPDNWRELLNDSNKLELVDNIVIKEECSQLTTDDNNE